MDESSIFNADQVEKNLHTKHTRERHGLISYK